MSDRKLAVVTGASSGFGYQFARLAAEDGHDLIIVADEPEIGAAAENLRRLGAKVDAHRLDLATRDGIDRFWAGIKGKPIDLFFANAGRALGHAFVEQDWPDIQQLVDLNIRQTTIMLYRVGTKMHQRGSGRILVTGSIGGLVPGPYDAVYNGTKAYIDSLCAALQDEWRDMDTAVTLTNLMPGPADTRIFERAGMDSAPITDEGRLADHQQVAREGYLAMMQGEKGHIPGFGSKLITMFSNVLPQSLLAEFHRKGAEPRK